MTCACACVCVCVCLHDLCVCVCVCVCVSAWLVRVRVCVGPILGSFVCACIVRREAAGVFSGHVGQGFRAGFRIAYPLCMCCLPRCWYVCACTSGVAMSA